MPYNSKRTVRQANSGFLLTVFQLIYNIIIYLFSALKMGKAITPKKKQEDDRAIEELLDFIGPIKNNTLLSTQKTHKVTSKQKIKKPKDQGNKEKLKAKADELEIVNAGDSSSKNHAIISTANYQNLTDDKIKLKIKKKHKKKVNTHSSKSKNSYFEITCDFLNLKTERLESKYEKATELSDLPLELVHYITVFLDKDSKLSLRATGHFYKALIDRLYRFLSQGQYIFQLIQSSEILFKDYPELKCFKHPGESFLNSARTSYRKLKEKHKPYHRIEEYNNPDISLKIQPQEKKLFHFYKSSTNNRDEIDEKLLNEAIVNYRYCLYEKEHLHYKIVFHVEKKETIRDAVQCWQGSKKSKDGKFSVGKYETFFYPIKQIGGLPLMKPGTLISILVMPDSLFAGNEYKSKTDFVRHLIRYTSNSSPAKVKQEIGDCVYFIDPNFRVVTWQLGDAGEIGEYKINKNRHLGIDIAITGSAKESFEAVLPQYLTALKTEIETCNRAFQTLKP